MTSPKLLQDYHGAEARAATQVDEHPWHQPTQPQPHIHQHARFPQNGPTWHAVVEKDAARPEDALDNDNCI